MRIAAWALSGAALLAALWTAAGGGADTLGLFLDSPSRIARTPAAPVECATRPLDGLAELPPAMRALLAAPTLGAPETAATGATVRPLAPEATSDAAPEPAAGVSADRHAAELAPDLVERLVLALSPPAAPVARDETPTPALDPVRDETPARPQNDDGWRVRGDALLARGDVAAARLFYQRAMEAGDGRATMQLAKTFDPLFLEPLSAGTLRGDVARSARLYALAAERGDAEAEARLRLLRQRFP